MGNFGAIVPTVEPSGTTPQDCTFQIGPATFESGGLLHLETDPQ